MANRRLTYRGHKIVVGDDASQLTVDGQQLPVSRLASDLYATILLPYTNFTSLDALGRAIIDHTPQFSGRRDVK